MGAESRPRDAGLSVLRLADGAELPTRLPPPSTFEAARASSLAAGVLAASMVGCVYAFNLLSHPMKHRFSLDQADALHALLTAWSCSAWPCKL